MKRYVLSIDQGTTGTKVMFADQTGAIAAESYQKHAQHYPRAGWVEHDPLEIWERIVAGVSEAMRQGKIVPKEVAAVGLANQGETVMFWDGESGAPLYPAVVWSCRRSDRIAERWAQDGDWDEKVADKTGLRIDPYFSATKIRWLMEEVPAVRDSIAGGRARCSTLDAWIIWNMTGGAAYVTDASTAARTLLFNHRLRRWDEEILAYLEIDKSWLPTIKPSVGTFGFSDPAAFCGIRAPVLVSLVDQPAALYGHLCTLPGMSKCTYGTGCFAYMQVGETPPPAVGGGLLTTVVWQREERLSYALDGAIYSAGTAVDWGMQALGLYRDVDELQAWSREWYEAIGGEQSEGDDDGVLFVPALTGIGTPFWRSDARAVFSGLSLTTDRKRMARSILDGIAHRVADVLEAMEAAVGTKLTVLRVDGGLTKNPYLMQTQADLLGIPVEVPEMKETTSMGIVYLLGEALGWWTQDELQRAVRTVERYEPKRGTAFRTQARECWKKTVHSLVGPM